MTELEKTYWVEGQNNYGLWVEIGSYVICGAAIEHMESLSSNKKNGVFRVVCKTTELIRQAENREKAVNYVIRYWNPIRNEWVDLKTYSSPDLEKVIKSLKDRRSRNQGEVYKIVKEKIVCKDVSEDLIERQTNEQ